MSGSSSEPPKVIPARLSFLAIYNPYLGTTDETLREQIVFYYSRAAKERRKLRTKDTDSERRQHEEENEKLRQVGLAQGMVEFAKGFSNGEAIDSIETGKSRIVIKELEDRWWILASIDLTCLPASSSSATAAPASKPTSSSATAKPSVEYSAREVSPPALLIKQLQLAYSIFLLHHASTLSDLWMRLPRNRFCSTLERFWTRFSQTWDVLLHGNPAADIYGGIKLAAGGELGIGVGEEEWGSGEREVLEDYIRRTDGLVDVIVSRYGEAAEDNDLAVGSRFTEASATARKQTWLGTAQCPRKVDGVIFSGVGAVSRRAVQHISQWMGMIYEYGEEAYGVGQSPSSARRRRSGKKARREKSNGDAHLGKKEEADRKPTAKHERSYDAEPAAGTEGNDRDVSGIPPPIVSAAGVPRNNATTVGGVPRKAEAEQVNSSASVFGDAETWMKYLTLGYGSTWGGGEKRPQDESQPSRSTTQNRTQNQPAWNIFASGTRATSTTGNNKPDEGPLEAKLDESAGRFLIGLQGDPECEDAEDAESGTGTDSEAGDGWNSRIILRTLHVEMSDKRKHGTDGDDHHSRNKASTGSATSMERRAANRFERLRVLVYIRQPFIFTFLFSDQTIQLTLPSFYRALHHHIGPLHKPLLASTSPSQVAARISNFSRPHSTYPKSNSSAPANPIFDLVYDPSNLTIHTSIPNIPPPGTPAAEGLGHPWTRLEALNVHTQILSVYSATRRKRREIERTAKTSRGWWVVWIRLPRDEGDGDDADARDGQEECREAVLVRRASDYVAPASWTRSVSGGNADAAGWAPGRLAEGIGVDVRKYIEGLLSLNR